MRIVYFTFMSPNISTKSCDLFPKAKWYRISSLSREMLGFLMRKPSDVASEIPLVGALLVLVDESGAAVGPPEDVGAPEEVGG